MRIGEYIPCMAKSRNDGHFVVGKPPAGLTWQVASTLSMLNGSVPSNQRFI